MPDHAKPFKTTVARPVPPEFEPLFLAHGWTRVNAVFGKRAALRFFTAIGAERLSAARRSALFGSPDAAAAQRARLGTPDPFLAHYQRFGAFPKVDADARV